VVTRVIQQEHENLARLEGLTKPVIMELVQDLLQSRTVIFVGSITSAPLAAYAATELNILLGKVRFFDSADSAAWLHVRDCAPDDVVVGISFPRYAQSTLDLLRKFRPKVRSLWLLTDEIGPRNVRDLGRLVRLPITAHGSFRSRASVVSLVQILAVLLAETSPETILAKVDEADEAWREARFVTMYTAQADRPSRRKK
jgi:DNA-binding MurR/RpiR family transcriptional regulator